MQLSMWHLNGQPTFTKRNTSAGLQSRRSGLGQTDISELPPMLAKEGSQNDYSFGS